MCYFVSTPQKPKTPTKDMELTNSFLNTALPKNSKVFLLEENHQSMGTDNEKISRNAYEWLDKNKIFTTISIDTRTIQSNEIFCAIDGENVDGHEFIKKALEKNAIGFIADKKKIEKLNLGSSPGKKLVILVDDPVETIIQLAKHWRQKFSCPIVGITGSIGKTTTKEILRTILKNSDMHACISLANQNSLLGLPLNILRLEKEHEAGIFEVGIDEPGAMEKQADLLMPTNALITGIAHSHVSNFGNLDGIAREKKLIFKNFSPSDIGIIFGDQKILSGAYYSHPVAKFGFKSKNQIQGKDVNFEVISPNGQQKITFTLRIYSEERIVKMHGLPKSIVQNALGASAVAHFLGLSIDQIVSGLKKFKGVPGRYEIMPVKDGRGTIINDCYNANPESMLASLDAFDKLESIDKILVLGDMLELGEKESFWHRRIGKRVATMKGIKTLILVGKLSKLMANEILETNTTIANNWLEAYEKLTSSIDKKSVVLVKASNGIELSKIVGRLT